MAERIFYAGALRDRNVVGFAPAKFLVRNGAYAVDPTPGGSQVALYADDRGSNRTEGKIANPNNDEPAPADWPPQTSPPVRYLSSYRVRY
jgi:hypothetical protein